MKSLFAILAFSICFATPALAVAAECDGTALHPCTVEDTEQSSQGFRSWRTSVMMLKTYKGNISGLDRLRMSGSSEPMAAAWTGLVQKILQDMSHQSVEIWDVDLRQESHGYLNGISILLAAENNWANLNKNNADILQEESAWLQSLKALPQVHNVLTDDQFDDKHFSAGKTINVVSVASEESLANANNMHYVRFTIPDHRGPTDDEVQRFVTWQKTLPPNAWVHFHCRAGKGRTTTFMVMYDMLHNANHVGFNDIVKRQASVNPFYDVTKMSKSHPDLELYYKERLAFLRAFYNYSVAMLAGYKGSWVEYTASQSEPRT